MAKFVIQSVAVARAAPLVLIGRELISVGYSQGIPNIPIPNAPWNWKEGEKCEMLDNEEKCQVG